MGMGKSFHRFWSDESGISSVEYALLMAIVAGSISIAAGSLGTAVGNEIDTAADCVGDSVRCNDL